MIIGLGPEYNYPGDVREWAKDNTSYASNHGASFISRTLAKQFSGEYVNDFSDIEALKQKYDVCIIAFATHITTKRDVTRYADAIKKLDLPTFAFSLGLQDYSVTRSEIMNLHPSIKRLLSLVCERSNYLGVRGNYTAEILSQNGFKNVIPVGCPSLFWPLKRNLSINKPESFFKPAIVYHRTLAGEKTRHLLQGVPLVGQDFLDEAIFTSNLPNDPIRNAEIKRYNKQGKKELSFFL